LPSQSCKDTKTKFLLHALGHTNLISSELSSSKKIVGSRGSHPESMQKLKE
jgi:hypothetical protein